MELLEEIKEKINDSKFDPTDISEHFKKMLHEQLHISITPKQPNVPIFQLTSVETPSATTNFGGKTKGVKVSGTYGEKILGNALNPFDSTGNNIQLFFWDNEDEIECVAFFQLKASDWSMSKSFTIGHDKTAKYFGDLSASNLPLFALSTGNLWDADCTTIVSDDYTKNTWIHEKLNVFYFCEKSAIGSLPNYSIVQDFIADFATKVDVNFQLSGVIDNAESDFPIINLKLEMGTLDSALAEIKIPANALVLSFGLGTSKVPEAKDKDGKTTPTSLKTDSTLYLTLPMPSGCATEKIQFKDVVPNSKITEIEPDLTEGQKIPLSDLATVFVDLVSGGLINQLPPAFSTITNLDTTAVAGFGFTLVLKEKKKIDVSEEPSSSNKITKLHVSLERTALPEKLNELIPGVAFEASEEKPLTLDWDIDQPFGTKVWNTKLTGFLQFTGGNCSYEASYQKADTTKNIDEALAVSGKLKDVSFDDIANKYDFDLDGINFIPSGISEFDFSVKHDYTKKEDDFGFGISIDHENGAILNTGVSKVTFKSDSKKEDIEIDFFIGGECAKLTGDYDKKTKKWDAKGTAVLNEKLAIDLEFKPPKKEKKKKGEKQGDKKQDDKKSGYIVTGTLGDKKGGVIEDIVRLFYPELELPPFPEALQINEVDFIYNTDTDNFGLGIEDEGYGKITISSILDKPASKKQQVPASDSPPKIKRLWFIAIEITKEINFSHLPLVGHFIEKHGGLAITSVQLDIIREEISKDDAKKFLIPEGYPKLPAAKEDIPKEAIIQVKVDIIGKTHEFSLKTGKTIAKDKPAPKKLTNAVSAVSDEGTETGKEDGKVQHVGKSFGPVTIQNFSANYANKHIEIDINGGISLGGITLALNGLGIGIPYPFKEGDFEFKLHGLGIAINKGPLKVAGGFLQIEKGNFMGEVSVQAEEFGLTAFGGYDTNTPSPSFFIFANVDYPIGGPPFFFVDGIAGGFGINRAFKLPTTFEELDNYPLLPGGKNNPIPTPKDMEGGGTKAMQKLTDGLNALSDYIYPEQGNYWGAAGLDFSSFEMIKVEAVLSVSFGVGLSIGLLGSANMTLPIAEDPEPLAYLAINFIVAVDVEKGTFSTIGKITPASFIFSKSSHLTGGFAFDMWFKGEHQGDFLMSMGGYNPHFKKPAHYPSIPRLELNWGLGPFAMTGKSYYALTPKLMMAGLEISAHWHGGPVKAWFDAGIDFILGWKPFFYEADAYIHMTGKVDLLFTITIHAGADLTIWGPSFGGEAHFDLSVISFTIHFGSDKKPPAPLKWEEFKKLIPNSYPAATPDAFQDVVGAETDEPKWATTSIVPKKPIGTNSTTPIELSDDTIQIIEHLTNSPAAISDSADKKKLDNNQVYNWVIDANHFQLNIAGNVPLTEFSFNNDYYSYDGNDSTIDASKIFYVTNPIAFFANPHDPNQPDLPGKASVLVYDDGQTHQKSWWNAKEDDHGWWVGASKIGIAPLGSKKGRFTSKLAVELMKINSDDTLELVKETFVVKLVTKSSPAALWGDKGPGVSDVNAPPLIKETLVGIQVTPPIWSPEQTKFINIYELIFQQNPRNASIEALPTPASPSFDKHDANYEDKAKLMLKEAAFSRLSNNTLISNLQSEFAELEISATATQLATVGYEAEPLLSTLGADVNNLGSL